jgi:hypothetical protein
MSNLSLSLEGVEASSLSHGAQKTPPPPGERGPLVVVLVLVRVGGVEHTLREYYHTSNVVQSGRRSRFVWRAQPNLLRLLSGLEWA